LLVNPSLTQAPLSSNIELESKQINQHERNFDAGLNKNCVGEKIMSRSCVGPTRACKDKHINTIQKSSLELNDNSNQINGLLKSKNQFYPEDAKSSTVYSILSTNHQTTMLKSNDWPSFGNSL
jgi:hypothetical protein